MIRLQWRYLTVWIALLAAAAAWALSSAAYAFCDIKDDPGESAIRTLEDRGIVHGIGSGRYAPGAPLTYAQGVRMVLRAFGLQQGEPVEGANPDSPWYVQDWQDALELGLPLPATADPEASMTREEFARLLCQALERTGDYTFTNQFILIRDAGLISPEAMPDIQILLLSRAAALDEDMNFRPLESVNRSTAAVWLLGILDFAEASP